MTSSINSLPEALHVQISAYLVAPDVFSVLQVNRVWNRMGASRKFWLDLIERDADETLQEAAAREALISAIKKLYATQYHASLFDRVKWCPVQSQRSPSAREGHCIAVMGDKRILLTGGFCDDDRIHVLALENSAPTMGWRSIAPAFGTRPPLVYGATLTPLDSERAVRFGGFREGGYSAESNQVHVLHVREVNGDLQASWEAVTTQGPAPEGRAYHSATLLNGRYFVFIGGMQSTQSILNEAILDSETWTWLGTPVSDPESTIKPSCRHGHSTVLDSARNRLMIFGGGDGSDLLRSGIDNTEVWELKLGNDWRANLNQSLPWTWNCVHRNRDDADEEEDLPIRPVLSPSESLCLGRCHFGAKVSRDSVLLTLGSGHPTNNGILGYNLRSDSFARIEQVGGPLPIPRFTAAACVITNEGWLLAHGGYSSQYLGTLDDTLILDLAPGLNRQFDRLPMVSNPDEVPSSSPIADSEVSRGFVAPSMPLGGMLGHLLMVAPTDRPGLARDLLRRLVATGENNERAVHLLSAIADGSAVIGGLGEDDESDDSDDDSMEEEDSDGSRRLQV